MTTTSSLSRPRREKQKQENGASACELCVTSDVDREGADLQDSLGTALAVVMELGVQAWLC
jgi:hypothetical protein